MELSTYLQKVSGSATAQIFAEAKKLEKQGNHIIHLEMGQPDYPPIHEILQATADSVLRAETKYTITNGIFELRDAIAQYYSQKENTSLNPDKEVIATGGSKIAIFASLWSLINIGDNVIILNPSWVSYADIVTSLGGEPRFIPVSTNFDFDEDLMRKKIDKNTKAIIINSPSNPTGEVISSFNLNRLASIAQENKIVIISDEIYCEYLYNNNKHYSLMSLKNWKDFGIVINGLAKTFSMTGFRLGYAMAREDYIAQISKIMQLTTTCPVNFVQHASIVAFQHIEMVKKRIIEIMMKKRQIASEILSNSDVKYNDPKGAIYGWLGLPKIKNSVEFGRKLLIDTGVAITPGSAFGPAGEGYIRINLSSNDDLLREGITKIINYHQKY